MSKRKVKIQLFDDDGKLVKEEICDFLIGRIFDMNNQKVSGFTLAGSNVSPLDLVFSAYVIMDELYDYLLDDAKKDIPVNAELEVERLFNYVGTEIKKGFYIPQKQFDKIVDDEKQQH